MESCVTDLSELKRAGNIDMFNVVHSLSDIVEDGISDTTQENHQNAISLSVPAFEALTLGYWTNKSYIFPKSMTFLCDS